jgi:hypothetical protein
VSSLEGAVVSLSTALVQSCRDCCSCYTLSQDLPSSDKYIKQLLPIPLSLFLSLSLLWVTTPLLPTATIIIFKTACLFERQLICMVAYLASLTIRQHGLWSSAYLIA